MSDTRELEVLARCPFCGGVAAHGTIRYTEDHARKQKWKQSEFHFVNCISCGADNNGIVGHKTPKAASSHWNKREAADALAAMRAETEALTLILDACTEGTDWTYAQVPDELAAQREELERLRKRHEVYAMERAHMRATIDHLIRRLTDIHALIQPEGIKLPDGRVMVFVPPPELLRESWEALSRAIRGIPDSISFALSPLPAAPATEKEKP